MDASKSRAATLWLYARWCKAAKEKDKRKHYWTYIEKDGGRDEIRDDLAETIRSHYDRLERIAEDVERLGYMMAAKIVSEAMPQTPKGRSGDLGEILATELVEEEIDKRPVRILRVCGENAVPEKAFTFFCSMPDRRRSDVRIFHSCMR